MAANRPFSSAPLPFKALQDEETEEKNGNPNLTKEYSNLISALPKESHLRYYEGFWWPEDRLPGVISIKYNLIPRPTDLFLASFPKSGTTWLKALMFAIMTRTQYQLSHHPLLSFNPHECVPYMEEIFAAGKHYMLEKLPSPRILHTHMPFSMLPESITSSDCRIVYVWRDPKDVLVSMWNFGFRTRVVDTEQFDIFLRLFCDGKIGPLWDHILEYWNESIRRHGKILFLKYEEMLKEPVENAKRLAEFVGCKFSEDEEESGVIEEIVKLCSFKKLKDLTVNKVEIQGTSKLSNASYFRKGEAGDWRNHMTEEMAKEIDGIIQEKFAGSGLNI